MIKDSINLYRERKQAIEDKEERKQYARKFWLDTFWEVVNLKMFVLPFIRLIDWFHFKHSTCHIIPTANLPFAWHDSSEMCIGVRCGYVVYLWNFGQNGEHAATIIIKPTEENVWQQMIQKSKVSITTEERHAS